jgi:hypothetical protein
MSLSIPQSQIQLITEKELHRLIGRSLSSIRKDRMKGIGVPFIKWPSGQVFYDLRDISAYVDAHRQHSTSETWGSQAKIPNYSL